MNDGQLAAIRERAERATPGVWDRIHTGWEGFRIFGGKHVIGRVSGSADAEFIAHARQDIPDLLEEIERLRIVVAETIGEGVGRREALHAENVRLKAVEEAVRALFAEDAPIRYDDPRFPALMVSLHESLSALDEGGMP